MGILDSRDPCFVVLDCEYKGKYLVIINNNPQAAAWVDRKEIERRLGVGHTEISQIHKLCRDSRQEGA